MFDGDNSMYLGDDNSYKKKEAEMPKKLVGCLFVYLYFTTKSQVLHHNRHSSVSLIFIMGQT
jgi:hypothetical protein